MLRERSKIAEDDIKSFHQYDAGKLIQQTQPFWAASEFVRPQLNKIRK